MLSRRPLALLPTTPLSTVLSGSAVFVSAVVGSAAFAAAALTLPAYGAMQAAVAPSPVSAQIPQAAISGNARFVLASTSQGYLGVTVHDVDPNHAQKEKLASPTGAEVVSLDHDAPAAKAGVHTGDVIQSINGQLVTDAATLTRLLRDMPVGKFIDLQVIHNAKVMRVHLQLADRSALIQHAWAHHFHVPIPEPAPMVQGFAVQRSDGGDGVYSGDSDAPDPQAYVGAEVEPITPQLAKYFGVRAGNGLLVRSVEDKSPAGNAGLDAGDIIITANGMPLETAADWLQTLRTNAGHPVVILVLRNRKVLTLAITVDARITQSELVIPERLQRLRESLCRYAL
jgi:S1-C subfamily serine protease